MKNTKVLKSGVQKTMQHTSILIVAKTCNTPKAGSRIKRVIFFTSLAAIGLFFNGCTAGYVVTEPSYIEYSRPQRPSNVHIWIDGDWVYNRRTQGYVQNNGYWKKPAQGRTYVSGHWQTTPRGKNWTKGHWQRKAHKKSHRN
jgi:hypothetical protein